MAFDSREGSVGAVVVALVEIAKSEVVVGRGEIIRGLVGIDFFEEGLGGRVFFFGEVGVALPELHLDHLRFGEAAGGDLGVVVEGFVVSFFIEVIIPHIGQSLLVFRVGVQAADDLQRGRFPIFGFQPDAALSDIQPGLGAQHPGLGFLYRQQQVQGFLVFALCLGEQAIGEVAVPFLEGALCVTENGGLLGIGGQ